MKLTKKGIEVIIYKDNVLLAQFPTIQKAAHFMKAELRRERIPWSIINKAIHENISYTHTNGVVYRINQSNEQVHSNRPKKEHPQVDVQITSKKIESTRLEFIEFISRHLDEIIHLKLQISDPRLKQHHLSSKGLGDDLYFLTESYYRQKGLYNGKYSMTDFITPKALLKLQQKEKVKLIFEHMIPKNLYLNNLVNKAKQGILTYNEIYNVLMTYYYTCTVTEDEDNSLPSINMQEGWDGRNAFYRYQLAGIDFINNPKTF